MENEIFSYEEVSREGMIDMLEEADLIMGKQSSRIAALEAQNKKLAEALEGMVHASDVFFRDSGYPAIFHSGYLTKARALLSEVTQ